MKPVQEPNLGTKMSGLYTDPELGTDLNPP